MPLLIREARGVKLSAPGEAFLHHARAMLQHSQQLQADLQEYGAGLRGHVRVSVPTGLGDAFIAPLLLQFAERHPGISLRVFFANRVTDLIAAEIDVALKVTSEPPLDTVAREVCAIRWQLCASPEYLARVPLLNKPADLTACRFLCPPYTSRRFLLTLGRDSTCGPEREDVEITPYLQSEHFPFLMNAVRQGHGISLLAAAELAGTMCGAGRWCRCCRTGNPKGWETGFTSSPRPTRICRWPRGP